MESMTYQEWVDRRRSRSRHTGRSTVPHRKRRAVALGAAERRRLLQLCVCAAVFAVVLVGKGVFPERMVAAREELARILHADTDFTAAFAHLGQSMAVGEPVVETFGGFWDDIFGSGEEMRPVSTEGGAFYRAETKLLVEGAARPAGAYLRLTMPVGDGTEVQQETPFSDTAARPTVHQEPEVVHMDYTGPTLPDKATMDKYRLDVGETMAPVMGWVSSPFGWREHPVDGGEKFHNGVDLAVDLGTPVLAFASGTVDYIGESPIYGLYLQLDHGNGVTSFYAHCDALCVQQGQTVAAGEKIANAGQTGNATGPHLHFELKRNGVKLNPLYYIETR